MNIVQTTIKTLKISIGGNNKKNLEILRFVPDHLKTKRMCKNVVKKLSLAITYVPDLYKTQEMCDKVILENYELLSLLLTAARMKNV